MILLGVLLVLGILMTLVLNLSADASFATNMLMQTRQQDTAYYVGQSAVVAGLQLLPGSSGPHTLQDSWAVGSPPLIIDGYIVRVRCVDEERYFNPNSIIASNPAGDPDKIKALQRMLLLVEQDPNFANAMVDWIDSDSLRREPGGAESTDYPDRPCKNEPLDSIDEIKWIKGYDKQMLTGLDKGNKKLPSLLDLMTVYSSGTININTAPQMVIEAAAQTMDENVGEAFMQHRATEPFSQLQDVMNVPGVTSEHLYYLRKFCDIKSTTWRIEAYVTSRDPTNPVKLRVAGIFTGDATNFKVKGWQVNEVSDVDSLFPSSMSPIDFDALLNPNNSPSPSGSPSESPSASPSSDSSASPMPSPSSSGAGNSSPFGGNSSSFGSSPNARY